MGRIKNIRVETTTYKDFDMNEEEYPVYLENGNGFVKHTYYINGGEQKIVSTGEIENCEELRKDATKPLVQPDDLRFVNGYAAVELEDGFGYVLERNKKLLPYRFDVATNFGINGLALVGLGGRVTWINEDFEAYFDGKFIPIDNTSKYVDFKGYDIVNSFDSKGLSAVGDEVGNWFIQLINASGRVKTFKRYNYKLSMQESIKKIQISESSIAFDDDGIYIDDDGAIYSADGYVIYPEDLAYVVKEVGFNKRIFEVLKRDLVKNQMKLAKERKKSNQ